MADTHDPIRALFGDRRVDEGMIIAAQLLSTDRALQHYLDVESERVCSGYLRQISRPWIHKGGRKLDELTTSHSSNEHNTIGKVASLLL